MLYGVTQYLNNYHLSNGQTVILIKPDCALIDLHSTNNHAKKLMKFGNFPIYLI